jgi:DNA-binding SARP family transcriptional activator
VTRRLQGARVGPLLDGEGEYIESHRRSSSRPDPDVIAKRSGSLDEIVGATGGPSVLPPVRVYLLGPVLTLDAEGGQIEMTPRQATVLAMLASCLGQSLTRDQLIHGIWGDDPPLTAVNSVQVTISGLRRQLRQAGPGEFVLTARQGYALSTSTVTTDLLVMDAYRAIAADARSAGRDEAAIEALRRAIDLWRDDPVLDIRAPFADEFRLKAVERHIETLTEWIDVNIRCGRSAIVIERIRDSLSRFPRHQGLHARLMACLHNSGRTQDALDLYRQLRSALSRSFGTEPSPLVVRLHQAILHNEYPVELS